MKEIKPEDRTALVASAFAIITGLVTAGGGIATLIYALEANDREEHSGDIARAGGITAIVGGASAAIGGLAAVVMKLVEINGREDKPDGKMSNEKLDALITKVTELQTALDKDRKTVEKLEREEV